MGVQLNEDKYYALTAVLSPASVAANTSAEQTFTVNGLILGRDFPVSVIKPTAQAGLGIVGWRVTANNTLGITFMNNTGSPIVPTATQTYTILVSRPEKTYTVVPA